MSQLSVLFTAVASVSLTLCSAPSGESLKGIQYFDIHPFITNKDMAEITGKFCSSS